MTDFDNADLLRRFLRGAGLEDTHEEDVDLDLYPLLSSAEKEVIREIGIRYPKCLYAQQGGPGQLTASADRKTFTFGNDANGNPIVSMGWVQISPRLAAFSGETGYLWREGVDFLDEGTQIRIPSDRSYSGTLYWRGVPTPPRLAAAGTSVLQPAEARLLIVNRAVRRWAGEGNQRPDLVESMNQEWKELFPTWMLTYKRRFQGGGALLDPSMWYLYAPDLTTR